MLLHSCAAVSSTAARARCSRPPGLHRLGSRMAKLRITVPRLARPAPPSSAATSARRRARRVYAVNSSQTTPMAATSRRPSSDRPAVREVIRQFRCARHAPWFGRGGEQHRGLQTAGKPGSHGQPSTSALSMISSIWPAARLRLNDQVNNPGGETDGRLPHAVVDANPDVSSATRSSRAAAIGSPANTRQAMD